MPSYRHHDFGNLYIRFNVKFPDALTGPNGEAMSDDQRKALESVLPPRMPQSVPPADAMTEDYTLENLDARDQAGSQRNGMDMDDDDEHEGGGAERVQCASQ